MTIASAVLPSKKAAHVVKPMKAGIFPFIDGDAEVATREGDFCKTFSG